MGPDDCLVQHQVATLRAEYRRSSPPYGLSFIWEVADRCGSLGKTRRNAGEEGVMRCRYVSTNLLCVVLLMAVGCGERPKTPMSRAVQGAATVAAASGDKLEIVDGVPFKNLTIFPIVSAAVRDEDRFITLDEGVLAQTVKVLEVGAIGSNGQDRSGRAARVQVATANRELPDEAGNVADPFGDDDQVNLFESCPNVNRVMVLNRSEKPLYLMPGETIVGGQQDRALAEETIIPPGDKAVEVAVYCVEHGRWADRPATQTAMLAACPESWNSETLVAESAIPLARAVGRNGFLPGVGSLNKQTRLAVQLTKDQGAVWDSVAQANAKTSVDAPTGGFTGNFADSELLEDLKPYIDHCQKLVDQKQHVVGVVVAINGVVESVDVFESTPLFRKLWPKLLHGYAFDAATRADEEDAGKPVALNDATLLRRPRECRG